MRPSVPAMLAAVGVSVSMVHSRDAVPPDAVASPIASCPLMPLGAGVPDRGHRAPPGRPEHPRRERDRVGAEVEQRAAGELRPHDAVAGVEPLPHVGEDDARLAHHAVGEQLAHDVVAGQEERPHRLHAEDPGALRGLPDESRLPGIQPHRLLDEDVLAPAIASRACGRCRWCGVATGSRSRSQAAQLRALPFRPRSPRRGRRGAPGAGLRGCSSRADAGDRTEPAWLAAGVTVVRDGPPDMVEVRWAARSRDGRVEVIGPGTGHRFYDFPDGGAAWFEEDVTSSLAAGGGRARAFRSGPGAERAAVGTGLGFPSASAPPAGRR